MDRISRVSKASLCSPSAIIPLDAIRDERERDRKQEMICIWLATVSAQAGGPQYLTAKSKWKLFFLQRGQGKEKIKRNKVCYSHTEMINIDIHMLSFQNMTLRRRMLMEKDANIWKNEQHGSSVSFWVENQISASLEHLKMNPASNNTYSKHFYINRLLIFFNCI